MTTYMAYLPTARTISDHQRIKAVEFLDQQKAHSAQDQAYSDLHMPYANSIFWRYAICQPSLKAVCQYAGGIIHI